MTSIKINIKSLLYKRLFTLVVVLVYLLFFDWMYISYLSVSFDYFGCEYHSPTVNNLITSHVIAILPCLWIPIALKRPSLLIYWILYLVTFIPSIILPIYIQFNSPDQLLPLQIFLLLGILVIGSIYYMPLIKMPNVSLNKNLTIKISLILSVVLILYLIRIFNGNLHLVKLNEIYDLREQNSELSKGTLANYAVLLLGVTLCPFVLSYGLINKKWLFVIFSFVCQLFLFSTFGSKANLFSFIITIAIFFLIKSNNKYFGIKLTSILALSTGIINSIVQYGPDKIKETIKTIASILFLRTTAMAGLLTSQYFFFFNLHPKTYFSHINLISKFIEYPYGNVPLGKVVGGSFMDESLNANANLWLTDGYAACGLTGIIFISVICALVFWLLDSFAQKHDVVFSSLCLVLICLMLLNVSLFTTLFSGGVWFMALLFVITDKQEFNN